MKLHQLEAFVAVAVAGSLRGGARQLGLTQPALTKSIAQLEKELGIPLFERSARGVSPSIAGRAFLPRAEAAINELRRGVAELDQLAGTGGKVSMALSAAVALTALPDAIQGFRRAFPHATVRVTSGSVPLMVPQLRAGALDFAMAPRPAVQLGEEFAVTAVCSNRRVVVGRRNHPLRHATSLAQLTGAQWLASGATGLPPEDLDGVFAGLGLPLPTLATECDYPTALLALLGGTDMLAFLPHQWVEQGVLRGLFAVIPVREPLPAAEIVVVQRTGLPLTPAADCMLRLLLREMDVYARSQGVPPPAPPAHRGGRTARGR